MDARKNIKTNHLERYQYSLFSTCNLSPDPPILNITTFVGHYSNLSQRCESISFIAPITQIKQIFLFMTFSTLFLCVTFNASAMSKTAPDCQFLETAPQNEITDVHLVNSWSTLSNVTTIQRNHAAIGAMMRWNQQAESAMSFVYRGAISEGAYQANVCS